MRCLPLIELCHIRNSLHADADVQGRSREATCVVVNTVTEGYFEALGIPLLAGRGLRRSDHEERSGAAVLSASAARELWPSADPIGRRFRAGLQGSGACAASGALLLAAVGVYGVVAYAARQRTRELAVRIVLGATPHRVRGQVLWEAGPPTLLGLGLLASAGLARMLEPWLVGLDPADPATMGLATFLVAIVVAAATYVPAHRAAEANPADALRSA